VSQQLRTKLIFSVQPCLQPQLGEPLFSCELREQAKIKRFYFATIEICHGINGRCAGRLFRVLPLACPTLARRVLAWTISGFDGRSQFNQKILSAAVVARVVCEQRGYGPVLPCPARGNKVAFNR